MYIIDKTYFTKKISVPNTEEHNSESAIELNASIEKYARQFLKLTLGNTLFKDLDTYIIDGELDALAPQKWLNLVNGCDYLVGDKTFTWEGLKFTDGSVKQSMLAYFVYLNNYQNTLNTQLGQIVLNGKNSENQNPSEHLTFIYNEFVEMYQGYYENAHSYRINFINDSCYFRDYYNNSDYVSYLQFLTDNKVDYPDFKAGLIKFENRFGL